MEWARKFVSPLLIAGSLFVLPGASTPARASITDCLEAIAPVSEASKLADMAGNISACGSEATSNPVMAVTIALMVALRVDNQFNSSDQCNALVSSMIGKLIAEAMGQLGIIDEADVESILNGYISISDIPGSEILLHYTQCGCAVAGAADDAKKIADQYLAKVNGCAGFIGDVGGAIQEFFTSGPFKEGEHCLFDCAQLEAPVYDSPPDQYSYCAAGWRKGTVKPHMILKEQIGSNGAVTESTVWDGYSYDAIPPSSCTCGQPATQKIKITGSKPNESAFFACKCPNGEGYKPASGTTTNPATGANTCAACGANQILNKNYVCEDCALGTVKNPNFNVCSPACGNEPGMVFNAAINPSPANPNGPARNAARGCSPNTRFPETATEPANSVRPARSRRQGPIFAPMSALPGWTISSAGAASRNVPAADGRRSMRLVKFRTWSANPAPETRKPITRPIPAMPVRPTQR